MGVSMGMGRDMDRAGTWLRAWARVGVGFWRGRDGCTPGSVCRGRGWGCGRGGQGRGRTLGLEPTHHSQVHPQSISCCGCVAEGGSGDRGGGDWERGGRRPGAGDLSLERRPAAKDLEGEGGPTSGTSLMERRPDEGDLSPPRRLADQRRSAGGAGDSMGSPPPLPAVGPAQRWGGLRGGWCHSRRHPPPPGGVRADRWMHVVWQASEVARTAGRAERGERGGGGEWRGRRVGGGGGKGDDQFPRLHERGARASGTLA